ncbi:MAG: S8 family serine peptidase [Verrucomicrobiae bacterium]|nr:S8 family serine peptidase [Verrucomicrobiae bacterium]
MILLPGLPAAGQAILFQAINLTDVAEGSDLWRYEYRVSGYEFLADTGFAVYFDPASYSDLQSPPPFVNSDWDVLAVQPDLEIPDRGFYDALSIRVGPGAASLADPFVIDFVWRGVGQPGSQDFEIYRLVPEYQVVASGTTAAVPEPAVAVAMAVLVLGWALAGGRGRWRRAGVVGGILMAAGLAGGPTTGRAEIPGIEVAREALVSSRRVGRTEIEYTYTVRLTNPHPTDFFGLRATVFSTSPHTTLVEDTVSFGDLAAGQSRLGLNTFTLRHDRLFPFDPSALVWDVTVDGALLGGPPAGRALDVIIDLPGRAATPEDLVDGVLLDRLDVHFLEDATVDDVNRALAAIGARILDMLPGAPTLVVSVPRQPDADSMAALADLLSSQPGIDAVFVSRMASSGRVPYEVTAGTQADLDHLLSGRFPAAWNLGYLVLQQPNPIPVVVVDFFGASPPAWFPSKVPYFSMTHPSTGSYSHGYEVTAVVASDWTPNPPIGAHPFGFDGSAHLNLRGLQVAGFGWGDLIKHLTRVVYALSASGSKFVLNASLEYGEDLPLGNVPIERARHSAEWKRRTSGMWSNFVATVAAGNYRSREGGLVYEGARTAHYSNPLSAVTLSDPTFAWAASDPLWRSTNRDEPDVTASPAAAAALEASVTSAGLDLIPPAENTLVVGSIQQVDLDDIDAFLESTFSDETPDVVAVGEAVAVGQLPGGGARTNSGTSFAAPQVAGLAAYLLTVSQALPGNRLIDLPSSRTRDCILATSRTNGAGLRFIDAYAAVLSIDEATDPTPTSAPVRHSLMDAHENGVFNEHDVSRFMSNYFHEVAGVPMAPFHKVPATRDYSRYDLNGDGFTGGFRTDRFDLDRQDSTQYRESHFSPSVWMQIGDTEVLFNELALTDAQILAYYLHMPGFYAGTTRPPLDAGGYELSLAVTSGGDLSFIEPNVGINDAGTIAFTGFESGFSKVFVVPTNGVVSSVSFFSSTRTFGGAAINNASPARVASRDRVSGTPPTFFVRSWPEDGSLGATTIGRSPTYFNSATFYLDINDNGVVTFTALTDGSTTLSLFAGISEPPVRLTDLAVGGPLPIVRPQLSNSDHIVLRNQGSNIVVCRYPTAALETVATHAAGEAPGISPDGSTLAFLRDSGDGVSLHLAVLDPLAVRSWVVLSNVIGATLGFEAFSATDRTAVLSQGSPLVDQKVTLAFSGTRHGQAGIYAVDVVIRDVAPSGEPRDLRIVPISVTPVVREGMEVGETSRVFSSGTLWDPMNQYGDLAIRATFTDGTTGIIRGRRL